MFKFGDKEARLIQEQVDKNMTDIQDMKDKGTIALDGLDDRINTLEQKPECLPLTGGTLNGSLYVMDKVIISGKDGQDPMLEVGAGVADSHLSIQADKSLYSRVFTPTNSPYTFAETMRDGVFEWTIESGSKTATYRLPYGANMPTGNHFLALHDEVTALESMQSKQLETQRLEIADLDESTSQGLCEYEDTVAFTEEVTPIPDLLNDRKVIHGVRAILSSLDGDTKKVVASDNSEPTLMGFKPKSVKMMGREYSKDFVVGDKVRYISVPADFKQEWSDIVLNSPTYGNVRFRPNTTGSATWNLVDSVSGSTVYQSSQNLYGKEAIAVLPEEMTFNKWFNETRKWGDGIIKNVVGQDLIPTSLLNVTLNKVDTAKDQLIVHQQENGLFGVTHRKEVGEVDLGTLNWSWSGDGNGFSDGLASLISNDNVSLISGDFDHLSTNDTSGYWGGTIDKCYYSNENGRIYLRNANATSLETFKQLLNGVYLIYKLATPTETEIASDLSLSQVSALQNADYLVEIESETMQYGVRGSANLIITSTDSLSDRITGINNELQEEITNRENGDNALTTALGNKADYQQLGNIWSLPEGVSWSILLQNSFKIGKLVFTHLILKTTDAIPNGGVVLATLNTSLIYPNAAHLFPFADSSNAIKIGRFSNWDGNGKWNLSAYNAINANSTFVDFEFFFSIA